MPNILAYGPAGRASPLSPHHAILEQAGYAVARVTLDCGDARAAGTLAHAFAGRPPDLLLADLSAARDCLPLRHIRRLVSLAWDTPVPLPCLALLAGHHLSLPDWPAYADDFLLPPFACDETLARVRGLLFRAGQRGSDDTLRFADIVLDVVGGTAHDACGHALPLTPREYALLLFLVTHRGKFFARERLLDMVWGVHFEGSERTVDIHIRRLRAKLPAETAAHLETRRGLGYGLSRD